MESLIEKKMDSNTPINPIEPAAALETSDSWEEKAETIEQAAVGDMSTVVEHASASASASADEEEDSTAASELVKVALPPKPVLAADNLKFHDSWVFYYHDKNNKDWSLESYEEKYRFEKVGDCFRLFNNLRSVAFEMFFLMRNGYPPIWEHPKNIRGGALSFKIHKKDVDNFWLTACWLMIGETICRDPEEVVGISVSPKVNHPTVRLWFRDQRALPMIESSLNPQLLTLSDDYIIRKHQIGGGN